MAVERPTFSESWYRVAQLRPRLRSTVEVHRQHFRGRQWHVVQDPSSNQFFRLSDPAYRFVGLLDGRRSVGEAWRICCEQLGDEAPTQGEVIQMLGQMYASNLLQAEVPPDAEGLFRRYRKRVTREVQGYLMNVLFLRIPLLDPDRFLNAFVGVFGWIFSWAGVACWLTLMATALYMLAGHWRELLSSSRDVLDLQNLPLLYAGVVVAKVCHEFGHGFACKRFGRLSGTGGEVHVMGVMLLVFTPLPYVDASSMWAFRNKWHRAMTGAAGMYVELAIAAVAAILWTQLSPGTARAICYNVIFVASVSSLLFNGNPLLRYDAYYILSDVLEIPNLAQRSKEYLYYLVRRYVYGVRHPRNPAHTRGEKGWMVFYGIASTLYRVFISMMILLFLTDRLPRPLKILAVLFGAVTFGAWLLVPLGKFLKYLATSSELIRVRRRAILTTVAFVSALAVTFGLIPVGDRPRVDGRLHPVRKAAIYPREAGLVRGFAEAGPVEAGQALLVTDSAEIEAARAQARAQRDELLTLHRRAIEEKKYAQARVYAEKLAVKDEQLQVLQDRFERLTLRAPFRGEWVSPRVESLLGAFVRPGQKLGQVADMRRVRVRAGAGQEVAAMLWDQVGREVELRLAGRPRPQFCGTVERILQSGQQTTTDAGSDPRGRKDYDRRRQSPAAEGGASAAQGSAARADREKLFEIHVLLDAPSDCVLREGQEVVLRFDLGRKPLLLQWVRTIRQIFQKRLGAGR